MNKRRRVSNFREDCSDSQVRATGNQARLKTVKRHSNTVKLCYAAPPGFKLVAATRSCLFIYSYLLQLVTGNDHAPPSTQPSYITVHPFLKSLPGIVLDFYFVSRWKMRIISLYLQMIGNILSHGLYEKNSTWRRFEPVLIGSSGVCSTAVLQLLPKLHILFAFLACHLPVVGWFNQLFSCPLSTCPKQSSVN